MAVEPNFASCRTEGEESPARLPDPFPHVLQQALEGMAAVVEAAIIVQPETLQVLKQLANNLAR